MEKFNNVIPASKKSKIIKHLTPENASAFDRLGQKKSDCPMILSQWTQDKELLDLAQNLRKTDILTDREYDVKLQFFFEKFLYDAKAEFLPLKNKNENGLFNIKFGNIKHVKAERNQDTNNIQLATYDNTILTETMMLIAMFDQITPEVINNVITREFPEMLYPTVNLLAASWEPIRGMTHERTVGQPFPTVKKRGVKYQIYRTRNLAEKIVWQQEELYPLREVRSNSFDERGAALYIAKAVQQLEHRRTVKVIDDIYTSLSDGKIWWNGTNNLIDYQIPATNTLQSSLYGGSAWIDFVSGQYRPTNANLLEGWRIIMHSILKLYTGFGFNMYCNPETLAALIGNSTITPVTQFGTAFYIGSRPGNEDENQFMDIIKKFIGTQVNINLIIDSSLYIPDADDPHPNRYDPANPDKAVYLCPTGKIFLIPQLQSLGTGVGEYAYTPVVQNGGIENAQPGVAFFQVNTALSNTADGTENPSIHQALTFQANPLIKRPKDIWVIDCLN